MLERDDARRIFEKEKYNEKEEWNRILGTAKFSLAFPGERREIKCSFERSAWLERRPDLIGAVVVDLLPVAAEVYTCSGEGLG